MKTYVLIGFLLSCTVAASPIKDAEDYDSEIDTLESEYASKYTYVYDDDNNLVKVDLDDDDDETEEDTAKDLQNRVFFFLHTRDNPSEPEPLYLDEDASLQNSDFDPKRPTKIVTHGWINSRRSAACTLVRDAYIEHGDYNVIVVDWSKISFRPYVWASRRVVMVGQYVAAMLDFLEKHGMDLSQTTLVGHSLGAHVMGLAARNAKGQINYVVGLDPALPGFTFAGPGSRVSTGDANHVEIIHTNAGLLGYLSAIGDIDFYPNGGSRQLGCLLDVAGACSHARSYQFFAESINSPVGFHGKICKNYRQFRLGLCNSKPTSVMGGYKSKLFNRGTYFLKTRSKFPFALGK